MLFLRLIKIIGFLLLFVTIQITAQNATEVDNIIKKYPKSFLNPEQLASKIQKDFNTEYSKARAIYTWMAINMTYDVKAYLNPPKMKIIKYKDEYELERKEQEIKTKTINKAFNKRRAVCNGFSLLFNHLASLVGLKSEVIEGASKTSNYDIGKKRISVSHAWNSVQIDGVMHLVDVTWGCGYYNPDTQKFKNEFNSFYFDTPPGLFFEKHYPKSGMWENDIIDKEQFLNASLIYLDNPEINYKILEPKSGVIEVKENQIINFKIQNLSRFESLFYSLKSGKTKEIKSNDEKDNVLNFEICFDKNIGKYLTLYVSGKAIVTYKIKLE